MHLRKFHTEEMRKLEGSWRSFTVLKFHEVIKLDKIQGKMEIFLFSVADIARFAIHLPAVVNNMLAFH